jgi:hypothetical protein
MVKGRSILARLTLASIGAACNAPISASRAPTGATPIEISPPSPSAIDLPLRTPTRSPLSQVTPAIVVEPTGFVPTPTVVGVTLPLPSERLAILRPGPGSQVRSPVRIEGRGGPARYDRVHIRLLGEDGRVVARQTIDLYAYAGQTGPFYTDLAFDIPLVAEAGRLEVSTDDPRTGLLGHVTTTEVTLLSAGSPLIYPTIDGPEQLAIFSPRPDSAASGGRLHVEGGGWTMVEQPITVSLLSQVGDLLASEETWLDPRGVGVAGRFAVDLSYTIPYAQYGLITVAEPAPDGSGYLHFTSLEIFLRR